MGLYSALNASVSGMAAQTNTLTAISQNISNSDTTGYKQVAAQFEDVVTSASANGFNGAGVTTNYAYLNSEQGGFTTTNTTTDLAVNGNGFFMVQDSSGQQFLTRDGSFTPDSQGNLVNDAGYTLLGYPAGYTGPANSTQNLVPVNVNGPSSSQVPTTAGTFSANLQSTSAIVAAANLPSGGGTTYTSKTSLVTYDNLGAAVTLDVYFSNAGPDAAGNPTWEMDVYNQADAAPGGGFPYSVPAPPATEPVTSLDLTFNPATGALSSATDLASGNPVPTTAIPIGIPNGQTLNLNVSGMTQNASAFNITTANVNGSPPSSATGDVNILNDGTVSAVYTDGTTKPIYTIQLGTVQSPNNLLPLTGNVWQLSTSAGMLHLGQPGQNGAGTLKASTLEASTTDLATQLTQMIQAQNGYQANSKVFQTGTTLLEDLVNLIK